MNNQSITLGIIIGNHSFFPVRLCDTGYEEFPATLEKSGGSFALKF